jgi:sugar phosphate permease
VTLADLQASEPEGGQLEDNWTKRDALRTASFWSMSLGITTNSMVVTALWFFLHSVLDERGLTSASAQGQMYTVLAITSTVSTLLSGKLIDMGVLPNVQLAVSLTLTGLSMYLMTVVSEISTLLAVGALQGLSAGLCSTVAAVAYANYFGRQELASIGGVVQALNVLGSAMGPLPFGLSKDLTGSFDLGFLAAALVSGLAAAAAFTWGGPPKRKPAPPYVPNLTPTPKTAGAPQELTSRTPSAAV